MDTIEKVARALAWYDWQKYHAKGSLLDDVTMENMYVEPDYFERASAVLAVLNEQTVRTGRQGEN